MKAESGDSDMKQARVAFRESVPTRQGDVLLRKESVEVQPLRLPTEPKLVVVRANPQVDSFVRQPLK